MAYDNPSPKMFYIRCYNCSKTSTYNVKRSGDKQATCPYCNKELHFKVRYESTPNSNFPIETNGLMSADRPNTSYEQAKDHSTYKIECCNCKRVFKAPAIPFERTELQCPICKEYLYSVIIDEEGINTSGKSDPPFVKQLNHHLCLFKSLDSDALNEFRMYKRLLPFDDVIYTIEHADKLWCTSPAMYRSITTEKEKFRKQSACILYADTGYDSNHAYGFYVVFLESGLYATFEVKDYFDDIETEFKTGPHVLYLDIDGANISLTGRSIGFDEMLNNRNKRGRPYFVG